MRNRAWSDQAKDIGKLACDPIVVFQRLQEVK